MAGIGKFKLSDAVQSGPTPEESKKGGKPKSLHETIAEQQREISGSKQAKNAEGSIRDRMVDIGRGGKQAGRQGGS